MSVLLLVLLPAALGEVTMQGASLTVTAASIRHPFLVRDNINSGGYTGILGDLMHELSERLGFTYTIQETVDGRYGKNNGSGWNGMVGEVVRGEADIALADLTITAKREEAIDFTHPFMHVGLGVLAYTGYQKPAFRSLSELVADDSVRLGTFCCGSTAAAFRDSPDPLYQAAWAKMQRDGGLGLANGNQEGADRVLTGRGDFAYIMESTDLEFRVARNCQLTRVGDLFLPRGYGIAVAAGSPYRELLGREILRLQETGAMERITRQWLNLSGAQCPEPGMLDWFQGFL